MLTDQNMIFQSQTFPATSIGLSNSGLTQFRKEVIKIGKYIHPATKKAFEITVDVLDHWVSAFNRWIGNGNKVPIPLGHSKINNPEANAGWVTGLAVEDGSLYGIMELSDPKLALTTDVSLCIDSEVVDGKGVKYSNIITHISLCTDPVIAGLEKFIKLSLSKGANMEFLNKIAKALGLKDEKPTEDGVILALEGLKKPADKKELSQTVIDPLVKLTSESRALKLSNLVKAGLITPAVKDVITAKYIEVKALALSMSTKQDDGFDMLFEVLKQNKPMIFDEQSGVQSLELANQSTEQPNVMKE
ncbi:hypothetical protein LCGC14_1153350, partial [marine sediment metagenome]